jgi:hypothetical protein
MTTIKNFEELIAWQKSRELAGYAYELTRQDQFSRDFGLRDQIQRDDLLKKTQLVIQ